MRVQRPHSTSKGSAAENTPSQDGRKSAALPVILLAIATVACLAPFAGKAFHIDDPLFVWTARWIQSHPGDPYGLLVNWYGSDMEMWRIMWNPPLTPYCIALVARLVGWGEIGLHLAFLLPAIAVVLGTYFLARGFCRQPVVAALIAMLTPAFLVSSTTVMCDTTMLAFWVWAAVLWVWGIERLGRARLLLSAILASACVMTKFNGISLLPLLFVYAIFRLRRPGVWIGYLLIPVLVLLAYRWAGTRLYGPGFIGQAVQTATGADAQAGFSALKKSVVGLSFTGGIVIPVLFYSPLLFTRRALAVGIVLTAAGILLIPSLGSIGILALRSREAGTAWSAVVQLSVFGVTGVGLLALSIRDLLDRRDADSLFLSLWVVGTFIFAAFVAWSANGRYMLPMVPAAGILIVRRIERTSRAGLHRLAWPLVPAAVIALLVTWADYSLANTARDAARYIGDKYAGSADAPIGSGHVRTRALPTVWYHGHWGFQYYMMQARGTKPADSVKSTLRPNDLLVIPENNSKVYVLPRRFVRSLETTRFQAFPWVSAMDHRLGAAFHSDRWGPLPYAFGRVPPEEYEVVSISRRLSAPFGANLNVEMGIALNAGGRTKEAVRRFRAALEYEPRNARAMFQLGLVSEEQGNVKEAAGWYRKAVEADPSLAEAHLNLGAALRDEGKLDEAISEYEAAIKAKPDLGAAHNNLAVALYMKGDDAGAWREVRLARECGVNPDPGFIEALQQMSR